MFPFKEDLFRFDFEVDAEDEYMCLPSFGTGKLLRALSTPPTELAEIEADADGTTSVENSS